MSNLNFMHNIECDYNFSNIIEQTIVDLSLAISSAVLETVFKSQLYHFESFLLTSVNQCPQLDVPICEDNEESL